jgi:hypothetical protein
MSDVVAIALISGGFTALTGITAAVLAHLNSKRQTAATLSAVRAQGDVEIGRLLEEYREAERRRRQDAYAERLAALEWLAAMGRGSEAVAWTTWQEWEKRFHLLQNRVHLFAPRSVRTALDALTTKGIDPLPSAVRFVPGAGPDGLSAAFRNAYEEHRDAINSAWTELLEAMRADVAVHLPAPPATH